MFTYFNPLVHVLTQSLLRVTCHSIQEIQDFSSPLQGQGQELEVEGAGGTRASLSL